MTSVASVARPLPRLALLLATWAAAMLPTRTEAQGALRGSGDAAVRAIREGMGLASAGAADRAVARLLEGARLAESAGDRAIEGVALRGAASLLEARRPCSDSADLVLRTAVQRAEPGDRSAADARVRLLAGRGRADEARRVLVEAYRDVPSLGRAITKESVRYLQGQAAVERAGGHEAAALAALNGAIAIAARLSHGDTGDTIARPGGAIDAANAWVAFDLALLRATARSASVRSTRESTRLFALLAAVPADTLDGDDDEPHPTMRLADRAIIAAMAACARNGTPCPPPAPPGC